VPPEPVHVSVKVVVIVSAPVLRLPLVGVEPLQPPEAVHEVAPVELQVSVVEPPLPMLVLAALSDAVAAVERELPPDEPPPQPDSSAKRPTTQEQTV